MIVFNRVSKSYATRNGRHHVLDNVSFTIEKGQSVGVCGHNGAGKSTLLRLIAGVEQPSNGTIRRDMSVSWPLGLSSSFQSSLSGADNARFVARVYGRPVEEVLDFVEDFAELGNYLRMPLRTYSAGMMARLAFAVSLAISFDCYLIDEITAVGDERFQDRCREALLQRKQERSLFMVSHDPATLREYCDRGMAVQGGQVLQFDTVEEAIASHFAHA
ncbi:ATP-binding protein [Sphingopyxis sp. QXT-31]|uniref:ABC transporter ATP-binding protein n=1 Tax=Sphingopyxis sp. QXT-31 TaxID=1357916 RepID=UPI00097984BB|nr:ABC transporter ATP-binding protein [Sphingopyxis sp. QXT-31]APZ98189.1 ATP-binding protein [Sphingopyxis sp. QXT-31]